MLETNNRSYLTVAIGCILPNNWPTISGGKTFIVRLEKRKYDHANR